MTKPPHFICLGAHKSGTSWLLNCLYQHPEIFVQDKIDFFYSEKKQAVGIEGYQKKFLTSKRIAGELSTVYFFSETAAKRIYEYNPEVKLIVLLRNPIDRAYSHYLQDLKMGHLKKGTSFTEAMKLEKNIKLWGEYKTHLEHYKKLFPKERLKILFFDDIKINPSEVLTDVFEYLNVDTKFRPALFDKKINPARLPKNVSSDRMARRISTKLKQSVVGEKIWWQLKHSSLSRLYYKLNSTKKIPLKLTDVQLRKELYLYFRDDIDYVEQSLNRSDLNWR